MAGKKYKKRGFSDEVEGRLEEGIACTEKGHLNTFEVCDPPALSSVPNNMHISEVMGQAPGKGVAHADAGGLGGQKVSSLPAEEGLAHAMELVDSLARR